MNSDNPGRQKPQILFKTLEAPDFSLCTFYQGNSRQMPQYTSHVFMLETGIILLATTSRHGTG